MIAFRTPQDLALSLSALREGDFGLGETISHYKVLEKIGEGGMSEVYLAEDSRLDRVLIVFG